MIVLTHLLKHLSRHTIHYPYTKLVIALASLFITVRAAGAHLENTYFGMQEPPPAGADETISMIQGTVNVEPELETAVRDTLSMSRSALQPSAEHYAVTDVTVRDEWLFVSVIGLDGVGDDGQWSLPHNGTWFGLLLMTRDSHQRWRGAIKGTQDFSRLLDQVPENMIGREARQSLAGSNTRQSLSSTYRFPWPYGTSMRYGEFGVHSAGFSNFPGWRAVDLISDGDTEAGHAPNKLLAAAAGAVGYKCSAPPGQRSGAIQIDDLLYVHIIDRSDITSGRHYDQGEEIAQLMPGSFREYCGYASLPSNMFHLH